MSHEHRQNKFDEPVPDEGITDTSIFNAEEIVRRVESVDALRDRVAADPGTDSRRRFEALQEEKRLKAELRDLDDYDIEDYEVDEFEIDDYDIGD